MANNNQPPREVQLAYSNKCRRISEDVEKMARLAREYLPKELVAQLWLAQGIMFDLAFVIERDANSGQ